MKWIAPFGASTATERYKNAQPLVAGSNPDAKFFNNVLDELLAVITTANMTPTDENLHQISDAIVYLTERAATSGVIKGSYWFGKTKSGSSVPAPTAVGQTYIDFTTLKTYISNNGTSWTQSGTFTPPTGIDFTIVITSKFWDIIEQTDQQGGDAIYSHSTGTWTYWPKIVNLDSVVHLAGDETITGTKTFNVGGSNITLTRGPATFTEIQTALDNGTRSGGFRNISQNGNTTLMYVANGSTYRGGVGVVDDGTNIYGTAPKAPTTNLTTDDKIATTGWVNDATTATNVVHRNSAEIITGLKTISRDDSRISYLQSSVIDNTVTPAANQHLYFDFVDKNGVRLGIIGMRKAATGDYGVYMQAGNIGGLTMLTNGTNAWATAPASDVNGSVLTTLNKTKAQNGYFKLGNGLIIQWGLDTFNNTSTTINLPTAFTSTNYSVAFAPRDTSATYAVGAIVESQTTASFQAHGWNVQGPRTTTAFWIAIGY